jgi:crotonobetainyl-CoA:carnitine CoA-transferase CaiB-like acyl-CoA transferase
MTGRHAMVNYSPPQMLRCADGRYLSTGGPVRSPEQWQGMLALLDEAGVAGDLKNYPTAPNRNAAVAGDKAQMEQLQKLAAAQEALAAKTNAYDLFLKCQKINLQWGVIYYPEDVLTDPHFVARGFPVQVSHPELGKTFTYPGAPIRFTKTPWRIGRRAPLLGEDNTEVYRNFLGLEEGEYQSLMERKVV